MSPEEGGVWDPEGPFVVLFFIELSTKNHTKSVFGVPKSIMVLRMDPLGEVWRALSRGVGST